MVLPLCAPSCYLLIGVLLSLVFLLESLDTSITTKEVRKEYCLTEAMQAVCKEDEVIIVTSAKYGRMKLGRCVKTDFGFVGCYRDVIDLVDKKCSGRRRCAVNVPEPMFEDKRPCNEEFKSYLEAAYACVKVATSRPSACKNSGFLRLTQPLGYIANTVTDETGCGSETSPWVIEVPRGQRINITLLDFSRGQQTSTAPHQKEGPHRKHKCRKYAAIKEGRTGERISACRGSEREKIVYTSLTNTVQVHVVKSFDVEHRSYFVLQYKAVGCPDLPAPDNGWVNRKGGSTEFGCYDEEGKTWTIICHGDKWHGHMYNCTVEEPEPEAGAVVLGFLSLPMGTTVTLILGIAIGVSLLILFIGVIFIRNKRRRRRRGSEQNQTILLTDTSPMFRGVKEPMRGGPDAEPKYYAGGTLRRVDGPSDNDYAYVWEGRNPNPTLCPHHVTAHAPNCKHVLLSREDLIANECPYGRAAGYGEVEIAPQYFQLDPDLYHKAGNSINQVDLLSGENRKVNTLVTFARPRDSTDLDKSCDVRTNGLPGDGQELHVHPHSQPIHEEDGQNKINSVLQHISS